MNDPQEPSPAPAAGAPLETILGLDGLRAVSVLAVLLFHAHVPWMRGGYLGVEVFFVISGFLITGLLLKERAGTGRISLWPFWKRRLRRLLPALLAFLFCMGAYGLVFLGAQASQFRKDLFFSLAYVENWRQILSGASYFAEQGMPLLRHLWSLSVEGQFYLVWPFLVAGILGVSKGRKGPLGVLAALLLLASFGLMLRFADPGNLSGLKASESLNRAYLGTDTRAFGLLAGALLAMAVRSPGPGRALDWVLNLASVGALAGLGALMSRTDLQAPFLYHGGFLLVDLLTVLVIAAVARRRLWTGRVLGWAPLEWLGQRSYGLYLWHWPLFKLVAPGREDVRGWALRLGLTLLITELSYRCLEVPVRKGALKRWFTRPSRHTKPWAWRTATCAAITLAAALGLGEAFLLVRLPPYVDPVADSIRAGEAALDNRQPGPAAPDSGPPCSVPKTPAGPPEPMPALPLPEDLKGVHVTAIGDSVMKGAALNLKKAGDACLGSGMMLINAEESRAFLPALEIVRTYKREDRLGEVVVIHLGTNNSAISQDQFRKLMDLLSDRRLVLFLTVKSDKVSACDTVNKTLETLLAGSPNAHIFDWRTAAGTHPEYFYPDQTHLKPQGAQFYAAVILSQIAWYTKAVGQQARAVGATE